MKMQKIEKKTIITQVSLTVVLSFVVQSAFAYDIQATAFDDPRCDPLPQIDLRHELGEAPLFPILELIESSSAQTAQTVCVGDDGIANDWEVRILNTSPVAWKDMMFVVDAGNFVGNADGVVFDGGAAGIATDAFLIDPFGANANLLFESGIANVIFEPGETWVFLVTNFMAPGFPAPTPFDTLGIGGFSAPIALSTASIVANQVPIPAAAWLFGSALGLLGWVRRRGAGG